MGERLWVSNFGLNDIQGGTEVLGEEFSRAAKLKYISHKRAVPNGTPKSIWDMSLELDEWLRRIPEIDVLFRNSINGISFVESKPNIKKDIVVCCENFESEGTALLDINIQFASGKFGDYEKQSVAVSTADKVVVLSECERTAFSKIVDKNKLFKIEPHVDLDTFNIRLKRKNPRKKILFVGRMHLRKGWDIVLECAKEFKDFDFVAVAGLNGRTKLEGFGNLIVTGNLDNEELADLYAESDLLLMPSRYESFGFIYAEAMASGLPILTTKVGMFGEYDKELYENNFVMDAKTVESAKEMMYKFRDDGDNRGNERRVIAERRFGKERFERDVNDIIDNWE